MAAIVEKLLSGSLQKSSLPTYRRAWCLFEKFQIDTIGYTLQKLPIMPSTLALFIAYLYDKKYAPSTVSTYISAIGYCHRLAGFDDPTKTFYILEILKGYRKIGQKLDCRLPITLPILERVMEAGDIIGISNYQSIMFKSMCSLAFFAFLSIGEITISHENHNNVLHMNQVFKQCDVNGNTQSLRIEFWNFKHNYNNHPFSIVLKRQKKACPVQSLLDYIALRGIHDGPLFINERGNVIHRVQFSEMLMSALKFCKLDPNRYKGHSFRIGAATFAAEQGLSETKIKCLGRWKSDAFKKYIRISSLATS